MKKLFMIFSFLFSLLLTQNAYSAESNALLVYQQNSAQTTTYSTYQVKDSVYPAKYPIIYLNNVSYLSARDFGAVFGSNMKWYARRKMFVIASNNGFVAFLPYDKNAVVMINNKLQTTNLPLKLSKGSLYIPLDAVKLFHTNYSKVSTTAYSVYVSPWKHVYEKALDTFTEKSLAYLPKINTLSSYSTTFNANYKSRTNNLSLAAKSLNGLEIGPGKVFSFNKTVGRRTAQAGYQKAIIFVNKKKLEDYGGGVCQVSSTLYNSVLKANLKVLERHPHSLPVTYVPKGRDATVSYGFLDFVFKNNKKYPIYLKTEIIKNKLNISIFSKN